MIASVLGVGLSAAMAGCVVSSRSTLEHYGVPVGLATLERIPPGDSGAAWLEAVLGPPDDRRELDEPAGAEAWTWRSGQRERGSGNVLIIGGRTDRDDQVITEAIVRGGVVLEAEQRRRSGPIGSLPGPNPPAAGSAPAGVDAAPPAEGDPSGHPAEPASGHSAGT